MTHPDRWRDGTPGIFLGLRGLGQDINRVIIQFTRHGAPPVKPEVVIAGEYEESSFYRQLVHTATNVTNVMSKFGWDDGALADNQELDAALFFFTISLSKIRKQSGPEEARKMLDAAIDKIGKSDFFQTLPDGELKKTQWEVVLRENFTQAMEQRKNRR